MPGALPNTLQIISHLILFSNPQGTYYYYYYSHFKTSLRHEDVASSRSHASTQPREPRSHTDPSLIFLSSFYVPALLFSSFLASFHSVLTVTLRESLLSHFAEEESRVQRLCKLARASQQGEDQDSASQARCSAIGFLRGPLHILQRSSRPKNPKLQSWYLHHVGVTPKPTAFLCTTLLLQIEEK